MSSLFLPVVASLFIFTGICAQLCEISWENDITVECINANLIEVPSSDIPNDVQSLDLSNNKLVELKRTDWKHYESLETLYLTENEIARIKPDTFVDLKNLKNLDLSNNKLSCIPQRMFSSNSLLGTLKLRGNPELDIKPNEPFLFSKSLISLDISFCRLSSLNPQTFSQLPQLVYLNLRNNNLTKVDLETFNFLNDLNSLDLRNNKWDCDCKIVEILNWVTNKRINLGLRIEHSPVKCLDKGIYTKLWNAASLSNSCVMEHNGADSLKTKEKQNTQSSSDVTEANTNIREINNETPVQENSKKLPVDISSESTIENPSTENREKLTTNIPRITVFINSDTTELIGETYNNNNDQGLLEELKSREFDTILIFCILPVMLGISVFVAIFAVNRFTNWLDSRSRQKNVSETNVGFSEVPLMQPYIPNDSRCLDSISFVNGMEHIYQKIE